jgi:hypothetical protein
MSEGIYDQLKAAGVPLEHYESDLYAKVTTESANIVNRYPFVSQVSTFYNNIDHELWYDIPFAYQPFWDEKERIGKLFKR